ncbi:hypothetical protein F4677DRAFT_86294 [Hypoxylon crocopeplum]|nr:hypothetical protein F4677DRAFT_86294 [Hypoxylon crocopeplum]
MPTLDSIRVSGFDMASTRSGSITHDRFEAYETKFEHGSRVLSRGLMIGAGMFLSVIDRENKIYRYLLYIFGTSLFIHNALNWEAVKRYFTPVLAMTSALVLVTLPYSDGSVSRLLDRVPIYIMLMSLFIEELSRHLKSYSRHWERAPNPRQASLNADLKPYEQLAAFIPPRREELFDHMEGGEENGYHVPSQVSSDISLPTLGCGRLPSSCDSMTRSFWPNEAVPGHEPREENDETSNSEGLSKHTPPG